MRLSITSAPPPEGDMTPMIDMTFQLIAFFMVLMNFTEAEIDQRIKLPSTALARPPEAPLENPIYIHLTEAGTVIVGGEEVSLEYARPQIQLEASILRRKKQSPSEAIVIIRADKNAQAGQVQDLIKLCQECEFQQFALRAQEEIEYQMAP